MRFRILPALIGVAVLTLGLRLGEIWTGLGGVATANEAAETAVGLVADPFDKVQVAQARAAEQADDAAADATSSSKGGAGGDTAASNAGETEVASTAADEGARIRDPLTMSEAEVELLQQLAERRKELQRREEALDRRQSLLKAAEKRLKADLAELENLKKEIENLLIEYDDQQAKQVKRLVSIYEKMDPEDAARIFEDLEMPVLLKVIDRMNERRTAPILAEMEPTKAQALTLELAKRRDLPIPRE